ncbi:hypothetical protein CLAFUW4_12278 [Fulvia fulva]|uniref:Glyoxal oxidase N-terminal domain-containing protein n=1 Tax=Passalora fulva TaxID=5499 RepID=A0A9Q8PEN7_PASFU|nr:uncharacterized protein CLAFUR5_11308 [Fulvia fulva]KAK4618263.1 hypothetical protein CLAFUR4_12283 [Fulvia fulva]KAK4618981.1 hypothetical protein CLAFUR0_12294 [Fulvia fulva]UJO21073.1 hypothetical protein CLAFUR5_11308 [Fulvia fulva]WPV18444.1 hypothetical protein CLAFUW4_12278 [Fulvia fulva]WPV33513.1 hypothetical protein CLAFUW7_12285 [Fulvia fulva]
MFLLQDSVLADGSAPPAQVDLDVVKFDAADDQNANKSFNLYPILQLLPNSNEQDEVFTLSGNMAEIRNYAPNEQVKALPNIPGGPRCFPSSAAATLLHMTPNTTHPTILVCGGGGGSGDIPDPQTLDTCYSIKHYDDNA